MKTTETLVKEFKERYPKYAKQIDEIKLKDSNQLLVYLRDGKTFLWDSCKGQGHLIKEFKHISELTEEEWKKGFSYILREKLREQNLRQKDLVEGSFVEKTAIGRYVTGKTIPNVFTLSQIAEVFGCDVIDLLPRDMVILD